ncbi:MAG TPA: 23S rRNA (adenine(2503)-C(2))-methyltransferase RlmN [Acidimicrobiales bacterium]
MPSPYDPDATALRDALAGEPAYRARQVDEGLWRQHRRPGELTVLPAALRARLDEEFPSALTSIAETTADAGRTTKWVFSLADGATIETVVMAYRDRVTACISSQAGCAMGCTFCATGQAGFRRHLAAAELIEQVVAAARHADPRRLSNVVFMGMGEPLANYDATLATIGALTSRMGLSARHLTVSTVGVAPAIERLARDAPTVTLAVSLHAANDELRTSLVPLNRTYPLARVEAACQVWTQATHRRVSFEWALIDGVNDRRQDAVELAAIAGRCRAHVNLIALNPTPGYAVAGTPRQRVTEFRDELEALGVTATVRATRGQEIAAACGQLAEVAGGRRRVSVGRVAPGD